MFTFVCQIFCAVWFRFFLNSVFFTVTIYMFTVNFTVNSDGGTHVDMKVFGDLSIEDTGERCTETITLSGDK